MTATEREVRLARQRAAQARWRKNNPEKVRAARARYRDARLAARATEREAAEAVARAEAERQAAARRSAAQAFTDVLEERSHALAVTIARAPYSGAGREARIRRAELLDLLAAIREATA